MTASAPRARRRPRTPGRLLPLLLATALLLPVAFLVLQAHRGIVADREVLERERLGVEYIRALGPVTEALVDAQTAAVTGQPPPREGLNKAVEHAATVDARIGGELGTSERWAGLRAKLEALPERSLTNPEVAFTAYSEVTDLLLSLHGKVRETSGLIRDSGADSYFLQDGIGEEMPEALVTAGRLNDMGVLIAARPAADRASSLAELSTLRFSALQPASDLVSNLQAAVDSSESTELGGDVLAPFDLYQQAIETMAVAAQPTGRVGTVDIARLTAARQQAQQAAQQLQPVILDEIDRLLQQRIDQLDREDLGVLGAGTVAGLLIAALMAIGWLSTRPSGGPVGAHAATGDTALEPMPRTAHEPIPDRQAQEQVPALQSAGQGSEAGGWRPFDVAR
ncbi:hypothetical protein [Micromonospora endophytica]|uniref:Uncharacterized protein n=1 Tax=Micromonospora endophytica TaxID=515350 RepID=A0A2W2CIK6_9ACTN|nr:hypothetical protein [Micromonospora endophytica]PZF99261.1 hypothetical protein C1I93_06285 [Micromonospora endophytica]RIW48735.1 hypothetical protein D3H59_06125 [Micromonospora endophytica]BCJ59943.1 hypothetical protein Jiend_33650 [Micromonospora endophytica]